MFFNSNCYPTKHNYKFSSIYLPMRSLLDFALTDRQVCCEIMPIFWKYPLLGNKPSRLRRVINTYIVCLSYKKLESLREMGITNLQDMITTSFNYPAFLQRLRTHSLWIGISSWLVPSRTV